MTFFDSLQLIFEDIRPQAEKFVVRHVDNLKFFDYAMTAAFAKAYEFNCKMIAAAEEDAFFMMPVLRGLCEDYIVLKFVSENLGSDKDKVIGLRLMEEKHKSSIAQWEFFSRFRIDQKLYFDDAFKAELDQTKKELRTLMKGFRLMKGASMPSVAEMARKSNSTELYEYVYHATSSLVHFNPRMLLRMGWGDIPEVTFSTQNFGVYYKHFACFYGAYLFALLCRWMINANLLDTKVQDDITKIEQLLENEDRWPELVTFEEMNIGTLHKMLMFKSPAEYNLRQNT